MKTTHTNNVYYGILDEVTNEGLSKYETNRWEWSATMDNGKFFRFNSFDDVTTAIETLIKSFRKADPECEICFKIITIKESLVLTKTGYSITS